MKFNFLSLPNFSPDMDFTNDFTKNGTKEVSSYIDVKEIASAFIESMPPEIIQKLNLFLTIGTYVLLSTFVYIFIKIIREIIGMKDSKNLKIIAENAKEINSKIGKRK